MATVVRRVVFVPGGVTPVALSYGPLLEQLGGEIEPLLKDLEVYAADAPPDGYSVQAEVEGLLRTVDDAGLSTFHLVGYSGGAAVCLALAAQHPGRLRSLAMFEPANVPGRWAPGEADDHPELAAVRGDLDQSQVVAEFTRRQLRPGVDPPAPPPGPPPPWMAKRPAGLAAMGAAFEAGEGDREALRRCTFPVYLAYGLLTEEFMVRRVRLLAGLLPDVWIQAYPGVHHFGPPQRTQPVKYAAALRQLWTRAEATGDQPAGGGDPGYAA